MILQLFSLCSEEGMYFELVTQGKYQRLHADPKHKIHSNFMQMQHTYLCL